MFNKVWGTPSFLIAVVQALGCYCMDGSYRAPVFPGRGDKDPFSQVGQPAPDRGRGCWGGEPRNQGCPERFGTQAPPFAPPPPAPSTVDARMRPGSQPRPGAFFLSLLILKRPAGTRPRPSQPEPAVSDHFRVSLS